MKMIKTSIVLLLTWSIVTACAAPRQDNSVSGEFFDGINAMLGKKRQHSIVVLDKTEAYVRGFIGRHPSDWLATVRNEGGEVAAFETEVPPRWEIIVSHALDVSDLPGRWTLKAYIEQEAKETPPALTRVELSCPLNLHMSEIEMKKFANSAITNAVLRAVRDDASRNQDPMILSVTLSIAEGGVISSEFRAWYLLATARYVKRGKLPLRTEESSVRAITGLRPMTVEDGSIVPANGRKIRDRSYGDGVPFARDDSGGMIFKD